MSSIRTCTEYLGTYLPRVWQAIVHDGARGVGMDAGDRDDMFLGSILLEQGCVAGNEGALLTYGYMHGYP